MLSCYFSRAKNSSPSTQAKMVSKFFMVSIFSRLQCNIGFDTVFPYHQETDACVAHRVHAIHSTLMKPENGKKFPINFTECISCFNKNFFLNTIFQAHVLQIVCAHTHKSKHSCSPKDIYLCLEKALYKCFM